MWYEREITDVYMRVYPKHLYIYGAQDLPNKDYMEKIGEELKKKAKKLEEVIGCNYDIYVQEEYSIICKFCEYDYGVIHDPRVIEPTCCEKAINEYESPRGERKDGQ